MLSIEDIFADRISKSDLIIFFRIYQRYETMFGKGLLGLDAKFRALPKRGEHPEEVNKTYDSQRLSTILHALKFLKIFSNAAQALIEEQNNPDCKFILGSLVLNQKRQILKSICFSLFTASSEFRGKYKTYLSPAPFSWETFEHFGGLLMNSAFQLVQFSGFFIQLDKIENVKHEFYNKEAVIEAAVEKIIKDDLDKMIAFFDMLQNNLDGKSPDSDLKPFQFFSIKGITRRMIDTSTFFKVMSLTSSVREYHGALRNKLPSKTADSNYSERMFIFTSETLDSSVTLDNLMKVHSVLRRIEMIGELLTGKYFSGDWKELDETIDWNAFHVLRDGIAHQDEGDNHAKFSHLLNTSGLLQDIVFKDFTEFNVRLQEICVKRYDSLTIYIRSQEEDFCNELVERERELYNRALAQNAAPKPPEEKIKLSKEQRAQKRKDEMDAAEARKKAVSDKLVGLESIRKAAAIFSAQGSSSGNSLNPKKRVQLALESLTNISNFFRTGAHITLNKGIDIALILDALYQNETLFDAVNYNLEQFIQHLDRIKDYDGIKGSFIEQQYESLRFLRNHLAHGAMLLDCRETEPGVAPEKYNLQQRQVASAIKSYVLHSPAVLVNAIKMIDSKETVLKSEKSLVM